VAAQIGNKLGDTVRVEDRRLADLDLGRRLQLGDVARHHAMPNGIVEGVRERSVCVNHGARRDATIPLAATAGAKRRMPGLDVERSQLLNQSAPDVRDDLAVRELAVALRGPGRDCLPRLPLVDPREHMVADRELGRLDV
jgi:hypothetical protein